MHYELAVIGGGPAGYCGALKAAQSGATVVLFENSMIGGTCLNVGCIPTKCYVSQAELLEKIRRNTDEGIFRDAGSFSYRKIFEKKERVVKKLTNGVTGLLKTAGVTVVREKATIGKDRIIRAGSKEYQADNILIATGSVNAVLPIPGIQGERVLDSTGLLALQKRPKSLIVIGTGVIGLEFASALQAMGCTVTAVDILPAILPKEDQEITAALQKEMMKKGVRFLLGYKVISIENTPGSKRVNLEKDGEICAVTAEYVLVSVGRKPVCDFADELGLEKDDLGFVRVDAHLKTSMEHVYAAGDITGGALLAHKAYAEAETAVENCLGKEKEVDLSLMPRCIFTLPNFAAVGMTEEEAKRKSAVVVGKFPFAASGKALAGDMEEGFVKWVAEKESGRLLGCHILGGEAAELIHMAVVALHKESTIQDFREMIIPHPTLGESVKESALACTGEALHIPNKKM